MIEVYMMCVITAAAQQCLPFNALSACLLAEKGLNTEVVQSSSCTAMEMLVYRAPMASPTPSRKPVTR